MPEITLNAEVGRPTGSSNAGRLRTTGRIPAVLYGHGIDPLSLSVDGRELRSALHHEAGINALLNLKLSDGGTHLALTKDIQRHPVRNTVVHVDFLVVSADEEVVSDVSITLVGEATLVLREGGVVDQSLTTLAIRSKATEIPNSIEIDISELKVGDAIRVGDVKLPGGSTTDLDPEEAIVVGQPPQVSDADLVTEAEAQAEAAAEESGEAAADTEAAGEAGEAAEGQSADSDAGGGEAPHGTDDQG
jgi:large subunit ribosomal protein L25